MKKLVLKQDVVARINSDEMNQLKGGGTDYICMSTNPEGHTCNGALTCVGATCEDTCFAQTSCPGRYSCDASCIGTCKSCASCNGHCVTTYSISCGGPGDACY